MTVDGFFERLPELGSGTKPNSRQCRTVCGILEEFVSVAIILGETRKHSVFRIIL